MPGFSIQTFGCKVNQCDSEVLRKKLLQHGLHHTAAADADLCILNTCTVTSVGDRKVRKAVRSTRRANPRATVVVTGCYAERAPGELESMPEVDLVLKRDDHEVVQRLLSKWGTAQPDRRNTREVSRSGWLRTRVFVKVQDGCDAFCSYCIVPYVRGPVISRPVSEVLEEVERLASNGFKEVVLAGIHLGFYGRDQGLETSLATLLVALERSSVPRIRLSSIEIEELDDELIGIISRSGKLCNHLHIPLQSADPAVLRGMNRRYQPEDVRKTLDRLLAISPDLAITTDVMVGFPGESDTAFENTFRFIQESSISRLHVFRYSNRPGTQAADMPGKIDPKVIGTRSQTLIALGERKSLAFRKRLIGRRFPVLVEANRGPRGLLTGLTPNYVRVELEDSDDSWLNEIIPVEILAATPKRTIGRQVRRAEKALTSSFQSVP